MREMVLPHGKVRLPAFFPDATRGFVRCADTSDLEKCGIAGLVMNTCHLMAKPGKAAVKALGGLHRFAGWPYPIVTDSGGFQVFSLIRENASMGEIRPTGIIFRREGKKTILTPEKCIRFQAACGSDIMTALDYCTHPDDPYETQALSVSATIRWGRRCMEEFQRVNNKSLLFGVIQGGGERALRRECADALIGMGFDGFCFGGWPLDGQGRLTIDMLAYTAELMPDDKIKYAMGIGRPENIVACARMGYNLFDCVIPTREARRHRLYVFNEKYASASDIELTLSNQERPDFYRYLYILDDPYRRDPRPVSHICDCYGCTRYSRAYIRHLISAGDSLGSRLATLHNLRFYTMLMERLREAQ